jgi:hypothetical protein
MCRLIDEFPNAEIKGCDNVQRGCCYSTTEGERIDEYGGNVEQLLARGKLQNLLRRTFSRPDACITNVA